MFGDNFFDRVYVNGYRWRWGVDVYAEGGPATFTAEYLEGSDDRLGQGLADDDLPDLVSRGWYVAGTYRADGSAEVGRGPRRRRRSSAEASGRSRRPSVSTSCG